MNVIKTFIFCLSFIFVASATPSTNFANFSDKVAYEISSELNNVDTINKLIPSFSFCLNKRSLELLGFLTQVEGNDQGYLLGFLRTYENIFIHLKSDLSPPLS